MQKGLFGKFISNREFFLPGGDDIDTSWAFVQSAGLKIDYLLFLSFPKSKVEKFVKLARILHKENIEIAAQLGIGSLIK